MTSNQWLMVAIVVMIGGVMVQAILQSQFKKYGKIMTKEGKRAETVARELLDAHGGAQMPIQAVNGNLTDHFDPRNQSLNLSRSVYGFSSIAAVSVAAHECGHAMQYVDHYTPMKIRGNLVPIVNLGSQGAFPLFLIGLFLGVGPLVYVGIVLFSLTLLFHLVTLPVELNASKRALEALQNGAYLDAEERIGAKKVLTAAAFTYVVAALTSLVQLARMMTLAGERRR